MEDGNQMIKVLYEDNHLLVVVKPINIPVQEDSSKDTDLLNMLKNYLKEKYNKPGNVYLGLVHRLDRPVGGVMVFAKTSKAASRLSEQVRTNKIIKKYLCVTQNKPVKKEDVFVDKLYKDTKLNIVKVDSKGKESKLSYELLDYDKENNLSLIKVDLITGRSHQIRVQFSSRNLPLYGDQKYNKNSKVGQQIALFSHYLEFIHPVTKEIMKFTYLPPTTKPWNYFKIN